MAAEFYVSPVGNDNNDGSILSPWKTFDRAVRVSGGISSGDTVYFKAGIYKQPSFHFTPSGKNLYTKTIFKAYPKERAILTDSNGYPPNVSIDDYVRIDGLWIGGIRDQERNANHIMSFNIGGSPIGTGKEIINSTIFGFKGNGLNFGSSQYYVVKNNRLIRTGLCPLPPALYPSACSGGAHGMYFQGGYGGNEGTFAQHLIIDNNIVVNGDGYGITGWHGNRSDIIMRNFIGGHWQGLSSGGKELPTWHLVSNYTLMLNNVLFSFGNAGATYLQSAQTIYANNMHLPGLVRSGNFSQNLITKNAFQRGSGDIESIPYDGQDPFERMGTNKQVVEDSMAKLDKIFLSENIELIYKNNTIEELFDKISNYGKNPQGTLKSSGYPLLSYLPLPNIGWGTYFPDLEDFYWKMFEENSYVHFDRYEKISSGPVISIIKTVDKDQTGESKLIIWTTNAPSITRIIYWPTNDFRSYRVINDNELKTKHNVILTNLEPCQTPYTVVIVGRNSSRDNLTPSFKEDHFATMTPLGGCIR